MRAQEGKTVKFSAEGTVTFRIDNGGIFIADYVSGSWNSSTVTLNRLGPDGSTYQAVVSAFSANGATLPTAPLYLAPGDYEFVCAAAIPTDPIFVRLTRVPGE
jgi:hypothetical protein